MAKADRQSSGDGVCGPVSARTALTVSVARAMPTMDATTTGHSRLFSRFAGLMLAAVAFCVVPMPMTAVATHWKDRATEMEMIDGYVTVAKGTEREAKLRMQAEFPKGATKLPTLLTYHGYGHGLGDPSSGWLRDWAAHNGYALMTVSVRGTGCSGGSWDFMSKQEAEDGKDVIDWIAGRDTDAQAQPWSNGKVAMIGESYSGFQQLPVAALKPRGLVAITPGQPVADLYRDIGYPGGISNTLLPAAFTAQILSWSAGSTDCADNQAIAPAEPTGTPATLFATSRWDDGAMHDRAPARNITDITVPTFTVVTWQDDTVNSRSIVELPKVSAPFHAVLSNGGHGYNIGVWYADLAQDRLKQFLDFYVRDIDTKGPTGIPFSEESPIQVWWESAQGPDPDGQRPRTNIVPRWTTGLSRMPAAQERETTLFLSSDGKLTAGAGSGSPDGYEYVGGTGQTAPDWSNPPVAGKSLVYTSAPLEKDLVVFGSASLDLWLDSSATDTDVQAVLTEVRPSEADEAEQQQEMYVQAGWLRASHRTLDDGRSTPTRPFHTHQRNDTQLLTPLKPELMRVEMRPFGHVFRAGSRLRVFIEAPPAKSGLWSFESLPGPALNRVYHDSAYPSALRLATLPGHTAPVRHAECGAVIRQPCRDNTIAAPAALAP